MSFMEFSELDDTDLQLLALLQEDASLSNVALAERVNVSPPTCLRRVRRLFDEGWIERQVAILGRDKLRGHLGHGLQALVEVTLDRQGAEHQDAFEARAVADRCTILRGGKLILGSTAQRVLLDASVLEVYANDRICLSTRVYPTLPDSVSASACRTGSASPGGMRVSSAG